MRKGTWKFSTSQFGNRIDNLVWEARTEDQTTTVVSCEKRRAVRVEQEIERLVVFERKREE
jgi:hypothetical protein